MRWSPPELLSDAQVARIQRRKKECGLTSDQFLGRFKEALKEITGVVQSHSAVKMRLDRVFYSRMRRPLSDTTKLALARALGWTLLEFEEAIVEQDEDLQRERRSLAGK
jgi:mttA/Hcf106 family